MATQLQLRHGTTAENDTFIGAMGEVTIDLDNKELRLHTGDNTEGGYGIARKDFTNLTEESKNISNWSSNVTNCITEIPQDIKLELSSSTLTLKAGSKVYVPNGFEADGVTPKFDVVTIASDLTYSAAWGTEEQIMVAIDTAGTSLSRTAMSRCTSGTTAPTETNYRWWYDLNTNLIKAYNSGSYSGINVSFPIAIISVPGDNTATVTKIDYTFNGFGVFGTTRFILPGVSGLVPDGFNADGSYKSIGITTPSVRIYNTSNSDRRTFGLALDSSGNITNDVNVATQKVLSGNGFERPVTVPDAYTYYYYYSTTENQWYSTYGNTTANWQKIYPFLLGEVTSVSTITYYKDYKSFRALDRNDLEFIGHQAMPSNKYIDITLGASGATYIMPADGFLFFSATSTASNQNIQLSGAVNCRVYSSAANQAWRINIPVSKGHSVGVNYSMPNSLGLRFVYSNSAQ